LSAENGLTEPFYRIKKNLNGTQNCTKMGALVNLISTPKIDEVEMKISK
jgi:hypothetical protein